MVTWHEGCIIVLLLQPTLEAALSRQRGCTTKLKGDERLSTWLPDTGRSL